MTRGTAYLITNKYIMSTQEFNGDMYLDGKGKDMIDCLDRSNCLKTFKTEIYKFNKENFDYNEELFYPEELSYFLDLKGEENSYTLEMTDKNYFDKFFSDWTFWKNISNKNVTIKTRDNIILTLKPKEQIAINFGKSAGHKITKPKPIKNDFVSTSTSIGLMEGRVTRIDSSGDGVYIDVGGDDELIEEFVCYEDII
tara:strand:- start:2689 stop:3279 length:591 start_codon:yes stop_codon:yes gene_type:complete